MLENHINNSCPTVPLPSNGTVGQTENKWDSAGTRAGQPSLKAIVRAAIERDKLRDKAGQEAKNLVPQSGIGWDKNMASVPSKNEYETWEERAAIIEHEAGIPKEWAEAFARVNVMMKPACFTAQEWQRLIDVAGHLLDEWVHELIAHGWQVADIFACHQIAPKARYDYAGLLLLMVSEKKKVVGVDSQKLAIACRDGVIQNFRKRDIPNNSIMLWLLP